MLNPPFTRREDIVEDYHGTPVADPYRWLEDDHSPETREWILAQQALTRGYLDEVPHLERLRARYTELWNYPRYSAPRREGDRYYFMLNSGLQNQPVLYMQERLDAEPRPIIDPNTLSSDGTVALITQSYSRDGRLLAYGLSSKGSDWQEIRVRRVDEGTEYDEVLQWCKFAGIAWRHDSSGFYYNRLPEPGSVPPEDENNYSRVFWHTLGTPQSSDILVYERPDNKELGFIPDISDDGKYLHLYVFHGTDSRNRLYYREIATDLANEAENSAPVVRLLDEADAAYTFVGNDGPIFYIHTDLDAPRGRLIAIDIRQPERAKWRELIPEREDVIAYTLLAGNHFVIAYEHDAHHRLFLYRKDGTFVREITLPTLGSIVGLTGKPEQNELFVQFTSYLYPPTIYHYDIATDKLTTFRSAEIRFDVSNYETKQVFFTSKDGTRVPMFLTHKKGLQLDGTNPTLLYGYGGFNISLTPSFGITPLVWIEQGGVYAVANLRGGNEYGEEWHRAGILEKKQNVFDDFIAAAEWLIANNYTNAKRLAISGRSNGGLLVAACMTQRPDLYGAVICGMPVIDMLRYHKWTVGRYWVPEYGNAEDNPEHFAFLHTYSPLHNVKADIAYPPTLILTADTDDRVVPGHARKFAATLQKAYSGENPILLRVEIKAGHGMGKPVSKVIQEECDTVAFLCKTFGME